MWERRPMLVLRPACPSFFSSWHSKAALMRLLHTEKLQYGINLDVTHYDGQVRAVAHSHACKVCSSVAWCIYDTMLVLAVWVEAPEPQLQSGRGGE